MRILVAFDDSRHARRALEEAAGRPWPRGSRLRVVMVLEEPFALEPPFRIEGAGPLVEQVRRARRSAARLRLREVLKRLRSKTKAAASVELREGNPKKELLEAIADWKPDLVFVGSQGKSGLARLFMGSVSHALVINAPCSVEVVKLPSGPSRVPLVTGFDPGAPYPTKRAGSSRPITPSPKRTVRPDVGCEGPARRPIMASPLLGHG